MLAIPEIREIIKKENVDLLKKMRQRIRWRRIGNFDKKK